MAARARALTFEGFAPRAFAWFEGLERDNSREYFQAHRPVFDAEVRGPFEALLAEVGTEVKVFRQHRDLRFSRDRTPYKTRIYGIADGRYAELSARGLYAGAGRHQMDREQLARYREAVDRGGGELAAIVAGVEAAGLTVEGWTLRTAPRGYAADHPHIELLRRKALFAGARLAPAPGISRAAALAHVVATWRAAEPLVAWLRGHAG